MLRNLVAGRVVVFEYPHGIILVENLVVCRIYFYRVLCSRNLRRAKHRHQDEGSRYYWLVGVFHIAPLR